jgi:hypothetical protein
MNNWDFIEKLIYINLEERKDRRDTIEEVLKVIPSKKIIRFNAIKEKNGHIGASKSHIECIKMAIKNNWHGVRRFGGVFVCHTTVSTAAISTPKTHH